MVNPIKKKMQEKMMQKAAGQARKATPKLMAFAVSNDPGYNALMTSIRGINEGRKKNRRYIFKIDDKPSR